MLISACSGCSGPSGSTPPPTLTGSQPSLSLTPNTIYLTPEMPWGSFYAQSDTIGVSYTPRAAPACSRSIGSIVVVGGGVAQVGLPLAFYVAATLATPPPSCSIVVVGSDKSAAVVNVYYSN
jgi:hypothetical protein